MRAIRCTFVFLAMAILFAVPTNSCSFVEEPVFVFGLRPPAPMSAYVGGNLGVIFPSFAKSHLVVAWRYLSGKPLSDSERKEMVAYYEPRLDVDYEKRRLETEPVDVWVALRNTVVPDNDRPPDTTEGMYYTDFVNCTNDAFRTATATLQTHIKELGASHPAVVDWVKAQNAVFTNCGHHGGMPAPADASLPAAFRFDRSYQIAAASFYGGDFDRAHAAFLAISRDSQSPWRRIARLVAARSLIRKGVLTGNDQEDEAALKAADEELRAIVSDEDMRTLHRAADELDDYVNLHIAPQQVNAKLAAEIRDGKLTRQNVTDYISTLDNEDVKPSDEMSDWVQTFHAETDDEHPTPAARDSAAFDHAQERWQATHAVPWLVAAMTFAPKEAPVVRDLLTAAAQVDRHSPAYLMVAYHRARLLIDRGETKESRHVLDAVLTPGGESTIPSASENLFRALRLPLTTSLAEFVADAPRKAVGDQLNDGWRSTASTLFDEDAASVIDQHLPLSSLLPASRLPNVPPDIRAQLLAAAFTRAIVLGKPEIAQKLVPEMQRDFDAKEDLDRFARAPHSKLRIAAIDLLIHMPGLSPYVLPQENRASDGQARAAITENVHSSGHENWWCVGGLRTWEVIYPGGRNKTPASIPEFAEPFRAESDAEQKDLQISGSSFVLRGALIWAKETPDDPRLPESLALAIRETQWSCPDADTRKFARAAFDLLHSQYGKTKAAAATKYWYDGRD